MKPGRPGAGKRLQSRRERCKTRKGNIVTITLAESAVDKLFAQKHQIPSPA
ncbi:MAG: hypothetical protein LBQ33_02380 [Oscillospiraceae bacterium]|nr:hypothetical protein [Oscillospiraceae bacterium]